MAWVPLPTGGETRLLWGLSLSSPEKPGLTLVIDTGLTTWGKEPRNEPAAAPVLKVAACLLTGLGAKVVMPTGTGFDSRWFDESVKAVG